MNGLTTSEAAERLGVPKTTLNTWLGQLPIPHDTDSRGRKRLDADALAVLETVKGLRGEDCGYQTIRRRIGTQTESEGTEIERNQIAVGVQPEQDRSPAPLDTAAIVEAVTTAIAGQTDLSEKYARATYTIGQLEERTHNLEADRERLVGELAGARARVAQLEATPTRPWWKVWG